MTYWLVFFIVPAILSSLAAMYTRATFARFSRTPASSGYTGAEAARQLLETNGVFNVMIQEVGGFLSDHYDPVSRKLRLSPGVYNSQSLSAIGVACHEAGHALQHATNYGPLGLRSILVPAAQIGTWSSWILLMLGASLKFMGLIKLGIALFALVVLFYIVTLPVEWDATARAKKLMVSSGIVSSREATMAGQVLNAAFLTYVAAAVVAVMQLLYYMMRFGLIGGRRSR